MLNQLYYKGFLVTAGPLLVGNLASGAYLHYTDEKIYGADAKFIIPTFSVFKSCFYGSIWFGFVPYTIGRMMLQSPRECQLKGTQSELYLNYNRNGLIPHFIPNHDGLTSVLKSNYRSPVDHFLDNLAKFL